MIGLQILERRRKVSEDVVTRFSRIAVANVSDVMSRLSSGGSDLRPMHSGGVMAGPALTVRTRPGDNLMIHKALDLAEEGDVIVVDAGGDLTNSLIGEMMLSIAERKRLGGVVLNGAVRDCASIRAKSFPVFALGVTHRGPYKDGPGEINVPISIGGMVIEPGDLVLGDDDGLLSIPYDAVEQIYPLALKKQQDEGKQIAAIRNGTNDRSWVDVALARAGLPQNKA